MEVAIMACLRAKRYMNIKSGHNLQSYVISKNDAEYYSRPVDSENIVAVS
jgi:hypothetical protein